MVGRLFQVREEFQVRAESFGLLRLGLLVLALLLSRVLFKALLLFWLLFLVSLLAQL